MFVIIMHYKKSIEEVDKYLAEHRAYLEEGYKKNYFIASGPQKPRTGGIILSQLKDQQQIEAILKQDPFIIHEIAEYKMIEFDPVKFHPNFSAFI